MIRASATGIKHENQGLPGDLKMPARFRNLQELKLKGDHLVTGINHLQHHLHR